MNDDAESGVVGLGAVGEGLVALGVRSDAAIAPCAPVSPEDVAGAYRQHYVSLCRLARLLVDDGGRAEELVQDAFARTFAARSSVREPAALLAYVRRSLVRACYSELRRRRVERRIGVGRASRSIDSLDTGLVPTIRPPIEHLGSSMAVKHALTALSPRQREAVILYYYADLDQEEIAFAMKCSVGTVKSQLSKARHHLGLLLAEFDAVREDEETDR